jgi:hypothetical protein
MYLLIRDWAGAGRDSFQMSVYVEGQNRWLCPDSAAGGSSQIFFLEIFRKGKAREKKL